MLITVASLKEKAELIREIDSTINDKLSYAIKKNVQKINSALKQLNKEYQEKLSDINIDHAASDDRGILIVDDKGNYQYKPDQAKKRLKAIREATDRYDERQVEVDFYYTHDCLRITELDPFLVEELTGIIFEPNPEN